MSRRGRAPSISALNPKRAESPELNELHQLVKGGNVPALTAYLDLPFDEREDINVQDHKGRTALHHASLSTVNSAEITLLLLRRGAYVHAITEKNFLTPLHCACIKGNLDPIRLLIKYGADLNAQAADGKVPLKMLSPTPEHRKFVKALLKSPPSPKQTKKDVEFFEACEAGDEARALILLEKGIDVNLAQEKTGLTPLMAACRQGREGIVHLLLLHFADLHKQDLGKNTALHWASARGNVGIVRMLIFFNASVNISDRDYHYTPLHWAAAKNHTGIVPLLMKCKANPNLPDKDGMTPLHIACRLGHLRVIEELLDQPEVQVNIADAYGVRPLHVAVRRGDTKVVNLLLVKGKADPTLETITGKTPLHDACDHFNPLLTKTLLEFGAKAAVNSKSIEGDTPLHLAVNCLKRGNAPIKFILKTINILFHFGAQPNIKNNHGRTPLLMIDLGQAQIEDSPEHFVARALVEGGANLEGYQQSSLLQETDRILFARLLSKISVTPLPPGWKRIEEAAQVYYVDSMGNRTLVAPQMWVLANDPRVETLSMTMRNQSLPRTAEFSLSDVSCSFCDEILFLPVTLDCGHNLCQPCLETLLKKSKPCPVCKAKIPKKEYSVNSMFASIVERSFPERFAARVAEMRP